MVTTLALKQPSKVSSSGTVSISDEGKCILPEQIYVRVLLMGLDDKLITNLS